MCRCQKLEIQSLVEDFSTWKKRKATYKFIKHLKVEYDGNIDQLFDKTLTAEGFNAIPTIVSNVRLLSLNSLADQSKA